jgi:septation ring formation regulator EzrA
MTKAIDAANSYIDFEEAIGLEELYARTLDLIIEIATEEEGEYDDKDAVIYIERLIEYANRYAKEEGEVKC